MEMITRCPQCDTAFPVTLEQLQLRKGYIRCIQCAHIFDGFEAAVPLDAPRRASDAQVPAPAEAPTEPTFTEPSETSGPVSPDTDDDKPYSTPGAPFVIPASDRFRIDEPSPAQPFSIGEGQPTPSPATRNPASEPRIPSVVRGREEMRGVGPSFTLSDPQAWPAGQREEPGLPMREITREREPSVRGHVDDRRAGQDDQADDFLFIEPHPRRRTASSPVFDGSPAPRAWMTPVWAVLAICALVVLLLQAVYVYRAQLANAFPGLRPTLEAACGQIGCTVAWDRHIDSIVITGSALRSTAAPGDDITSLTLEMTLRNVHARPQEWPAIVLDLKDASGTVVVRRNLLPDEWVPATLRDGPFAADSEVTVQVPVSVRGLKANGYQLDKFFP